MPDRILTETNAWACLNTERERLSNVHLKEMFDKDPQRAKTLSVNTDFAYFDYSRQRVSPETVSLLINLANEIGLKEKIEGMFKGEMVNITEKRPALHTALRNFSGEPVYVEGIDVMTDIKFVLDKIEDFSGKILSDKKIKNIVSIGIGGSYLGVDYLATALKKYAQEGMNLVFVSNVDGSDFYEKTLNLNPEETLVVIISKTFTTAETMKNANTAKEWILKGLNVSEYNAKNIIKDHFVAVSTAKDKVSEFGIDPNNMFGFWDWVGGRYSATSAVGAVPLSLYLGFDKFKEILEGAYWMDKHFRESPFEKNIPVLSGLIDIWNINFLGFKTRALMPYAQALSKLPAHTQQVEMESNGKSVDNDGRFVDYDTGEVIFGEAGTNGQHSFYQLIHQGKQVIPCDFIGFIESQYQLGETENNVSHHEELMANFFAQPDALAFGQSNISQHRHFDGNRPSSSILLKELNPFTAGLLLALTEHRTVVKGFIWNIGSFDQWGVELGKMLGRKIRDEIIKKHDNQEYVADGGNLSTNIMLNAFLNKKLP
jgi:glucose-6-phosphate isomerase